MNEKGTKLSATEAAKKAEEAIRNAEMLEEIARDAIGAAAQAREEAEQAKFMAKTVSKKRKEADESVKKVASVVQKNKIVDKKFVLDYLQQHAWDLHNKLDNVFDIRFEDDPPRIVMVVVPGPGGIDAMESPQLIHNGIKLPVELKAKNLGSVMVGKNITTGEIVTEDETQDETKDEIYHRSITGDAAKTLGVTEALGPHSLDNAAKKREAYEAWLKRHNIRKGS